MWSVFFVAGAEYGFAGSGGGTDSAMAALALVRAVTLPVTRGELVAAARAMLAKADVGLAGLADHAAHETAALAKVRQEQAEREFSGISGNTVLAARSLLRRIREVVSAHPEWEIGPSGPSLEKWRDLWS